MRVRDVVSDRPRFDLDSVSGSSTRPEFAKEMYVDSCHFDSLINGYRADRSLEIGCGFGKMTPWISEVANESHAIDQETDLVQITDDLYPEVTVEQAQASDLPYPDNHFDLVVIWGVLMHVPPDVIGQVEWEVERVTTTDGVILVSERVGGAEKMYRSWIRSSEFYEQMFTSKEIAVTRERDVERFRTEDHRDIGYRFE
jgi:ubiquinone/menaquinone biosynthesis C-methylase UbiE